MAFGCQVWLLGMVFECSIWHSCLGVVERSPFGDVRHLTILIFRRRKLRSGMLSFVVRMDVADLQCMFQSCLLTFMGCPFSLNVLDALYVFPISSTLSVVFRSKFHKFSSPV